jgi:Peptide N-acetyl-beta-D-glucosaminyl asparaginase amidase A
MTTSGAWLAISGAAVLLAAGAFSVSASVQAVPGTPFVLGSRVVASAEPPVSLPSTSPSIVTLFQHQAFDDHGNGSSTAARPHPFRFAPPRGHPEDWEKVVLEVDFSIPAGRQYDRTVAIWLGGVNLYFATTMEPEPDLAQHWHVARDLTDYSALFRKRRTGQIILNNWISPTTNQPIYVTARLLFYPRKAGHAAPAGADRVYPLSSDPIGKQQALNTPDDILSRRFTFPRNVERAYLDVIAQSQAHDERWYTCVDNRYLEKTRDYSLEAFEACDGGGFRGVEVLVDGKPAGLAPVYPWIFAGGIAPHLWLPTPGIQTLNFIPFRVDLTPFAGLLDDGEPHSVSVRVLGADHFFNVAANLLIYQDPHSAQLHGELLRDTLSETEPAGLTVQDDLHANQAGRIVGTIQTLMAQSYVSRGLLHTSRGDLITTVRYTEAFRNHQTFERPGATRYHETITQNTTVSTQVDRDLNGRLQNSISFQQQDPLSLDVRKTMVTTGQDFTALVAMRQGHEISLRRTNASGDTYHALLEENVDARDRAYGKTIPPPLDRSNFDHQEAGQETVQFKDSLGSCYDAEIVSREERLTAVHEGMGCPDHSQHLNSRSRPDNPWLMPLHP